MAYTKVTGTLVDIGDLDLTNVGQIQLDSIAGDADANTSITFSGSDVITIATGGSGRLTIGDGALSPVTDNQIDLGTSSLEFKDGYFDGTVTADAFAGPITGDLTGTLQTAAQTNITSVGTLTALTVDDITIDGSTITDSGGLGVVCGEILTFDVTSNIILDAGGGQISFKDDGTEIGVLENSSSDFKIESKVSDKDIVFVGNDNGSAVTALTLDMSDAGRALFNNNVTINNSGNTVYCDIFSDSGSNRGEGYFRFLTDGASANQAVAQIYMEQGSGDGAAQKSHMYFQVSDNGNPSTALQIENNKVVTTYGDLKETNDIIMLNNGRGISFAADTEDEVGAGSVGSELLHDYEEGTWTPGNNGTAFSTALGSYTKIGNRVFCQFKVVQGSGGASTGDWTGLPFTIRNSSDLGIGGGNVGYHNATSETWSISCENVNSTTFSIRRGPTQKQLPASDQMWGAFQYLV